VTADPGGAATTALTLVTGERITVAGAVEEVEETVLAAARGSLLELAWLTDASTGRPVALNPDHLVMLSDA
jgi:hypothetical protein